MRQLKPLLVLLAMAFAAIIWSRQHVAPAMHPDTVVQADRQQSRHQPGHATASDAFLPAQARDTLARIARGGPFEHSQDGVVFGNYEGLLPRQPRGYYHEYTVETPGAHNRGARRIITGGTPPQEWYYTDDHYRSFRRLEFSR